MLRRVVRCRAGLIVFCLCWRAAAELVAGETERSGSGAGLEMPKAIAIQRDDLPLAARRSIPESIDELRTIEQRVREITARVSPAVVAVSVGGANGSAVVISEGGLVLTAAHVSDRPEQSVIFKFPDGRTAKGITLGTNHGVDAGLMRITDPGPWPYVSMGDLRQLEMGDWVVAVGHPGGFEPERPPVVRLGRVIRLGSTFLQTDCTIISGDSGGPLFDLHGRVVAIHSRISESTAGNFHVPIDAYEQDWTRLAAGENWGEEAGRRPWTTIGVRCIDSDMACRISTVDPEGAAARAGLLAGDIVRRIDGHEITSSGELRRWISRLKPGHEAAVEIVRADEVKTLKVTVETRRRRR